MMMEQNARPEPYLEPGNQDGTECQKTRETIPGTLPETKRIEEMMMHRMPEYPEPKKSWWNKTVS